MRKLKESKASPVILDACVLMVGINKQNSDANFNFVHMKRTHLKPLFDYFEDIKIHEIVFSELDEARRDFIKEYIGKNVEIVGEGSLYGKDPIYTSIFNSIASHELFNYKRGESRNKGDVYSLAYAAHYKIPFFSTRDGSIMRILEELPELKDVELIGFEYVLTIACLYGEKNKDVYTALKALYKYACLPSIKYGKIPPTFVEFLKTLQND